METIQSYKCPCCGDSLIFKGDSLNCESCGNSFPVETMRQIDEAQGEAQGASKFDWEHYEPRNYDDTGNIKLSDYNCPSCGAQITGDDTIGATVCPYCGNATIVKEQFEGTLKPDYIIPFKLDKKAAMAVFEEDFKNAPFLPDTFKNKKKIQEMSGVYVPFWTFDCDCNAAITYNAQRVKTWSDSQYYYRKTDYFKIYRSGSIGFANIPVDGSKKVDNTYSEAIEPFNYNEAMEFDGAYLSGYLADKYDVTAEESVARANERVENSTVSAFNNTIKGYGAVVPEHKKISFSGGKIRYALLPVWMLNIKYLDKMYHFEINGQTGKVVGEYPVDKGKKWKYFAKIAIPAYIAAVVIATLLLG